MSIMSTHVIRFHMEQNSTLHIWLIPHVWKEIRFRDVSSLNLGSNPSGKLKVGQVDPQLNYKMYQNSRS